MEHKSEIKNCQNCKKDFIIEPEDFNFYEKIKVPPPTFCPSCRFARRMIWRNERSLYKRTCDMCKKNIIAMYDDKVSFPVYCPECWWSDKWDSNDFSKEYDFSKNFFKQWQELFNKIPRQSLWKIGKSLNSDYANYTKDVKNIYLSYSVLLNSESVYFSSNVDNSKEVLDSYNIIDSQLLYQNIGSTKNYNCQYVYWSMNCMDSNFILDCRNCSNCFGCVNLVNKNYCIWNNQYSKEEYEKKIKELDLGSYNFIQKILKEFWDFSLQFPKKYGRIINCVNSNGDDLLNSKNVIHSFKGHDNQNIKYGYRITHAKDSMDVCHSWAELAYEHSSGGSENGLNVKFVLNGAPNLNNVEYVDVCRSSSYLFGCIALKNKKYCILNKQYEEKKYFEMVEKIIEHMDQLPYIDKKGRVYKYGEFFPMELCPHGYNESVTNDHFPLTEKEILEIGYPYKQKVDYEYIITLKAKDISDNIKDINDNILDEVIECGKSGRAFRLTKFELEFYRRMNIPIPRLHPDERYRERMKLKNPMILYHRSCMKKGCTNEFKTSYAPDRPEIVYCEKCYQQEVY